jgi:uncharacterized membrane protein YidH (DUF202 family)
LSHLFALIFRETRTFTRFAFVVITERSSLSAGFAFVQLGPTLVIFKIEPAVAIFAGTTIGVFLANAGPLGAVYRAAFATLASVIVVAGSVHFYRIGCVTF